MKALLVSLIACVALAPLPSVALDRPSANAMEAPANADEVVLAYQRRLDELLRLGDFEGARSVVETAARALAANERHSSTISAMYKQVRDKRVQKIEDYTTQIKEAVSSGDLASAEKHAAHLIQLTSGKAYPLGHDREGERLGSIREPDEERIGSSAIEITAEAEAAIQKQHLTRAPAGSRPASESIRELAALVGHDHPDVNRLADLAVATYRVLIDQMAEKEEYPAALEYLNRMAAIARTYERPVDQVDSLRTRLTRAHRVRQEYDQLLTAAKIHLDEGHLIAPSGANALEVAARAELLRPDRLEVAELVDTVVALYEDNIDALVAQKDWRSGLAQTNQLVAVLRQWQPRRAVLADRLERRASQLREADSAGRRPVLRKATMQPRDPVPAPQGRNDQPAYTYVTPF